MMTKAADCSQNTYNNYKGKTSLTGNNLGLVQPCEGILLVSTKIIVWL